MKKGSNKIILFLLLLLLSFSHLIAEEKAVAENSGESDSTAQSAVQEEKKVKFNFLFGSVQFYDRIRLSRFYSDYFGFLNIPLRGFFSIPIPSGLDWTGFELYGMDINGSPTNIKFLFGGGVKVSQYNRGIDGSRVEYSEGAFAEWWDEGFWKTQDQRGLEGKSYVARDYDVAWARASLQWEQKVKLTKSVGSELSFLFAYNAFFNYWLKDNNPNSRQLLFETNYPDRNASVTSQLAATIKYSYTKAPEQKFTHGLSNSISTSFTFDIAPGFMNPNVYGWRSQKKNEKGNPLYYYYNSKLPGPLKKLRLKTTKLSESELDFGPGGSPKMELTPTADYYHLRFDVYARQVLFDIAPNVRNNVLSGYIEGSTYIDWTSELGWEGYIPVHIRSDNRRFKTGAAGRLYINLPDITVLDLKAWSNPKANVGWSKVENGIFGFLGKVGLKYSGAQFNQITMFNPWLEFGLSAWYDRDYDGSFKDFWAERDYQFAQDNRNRFGMTLDSAFKLGILENMITLVVGYKIDFREMDVYFWGPM